MIKVINLKINDLSTEIAVNVSTDVGETITQALLWTSDTYKDYTQAIDVSSLLAGTSEVEDFVIPVAMADIPSFTGIFFLEFTTSDNVPEVGGTVSVTLDAVVANLTKFHLCILQTLMSVEISNCTVVQPASCCGDKTIDVAFLDTLLEGIYTSSLCYDFTTAAGLANTLTSLCGSCMCNTDADPTSNISGLLMMNANTGDCDPTIIERY